MKHVRCLLTASWNSINWVRLLALVVSLCLLSLSPTTLSQAAAPTLHFEHLSLEQGLSHGTVFSIVQDQTGFLWFGTPSGLNKYDGYTITVFKHDPANPKSLPNDNAGNLYIDRAGIIWIGTWGSGLVRLDPSTEEFSSYTVDPAKPDSLSSDRVQTIYEDRSGTLWVGTAGGGLNKFNAKTETFTRYRNDPANLKSLSNDRIWAITEDTTGHLWVATSEGLNKFDPQTETFTRYQNDPAQPGSLSNNLVRALLVDKTGTLWAGNEAGLDRFNPQTETFTHFKNDPANPNSLSDTTVNAVFEDSAGNFWVGTRSGGLNLFDRQAESFTRFVNDLRDSNSLSYNDVRAIYEDRSGVLWVATRGGGVNKFSPISGKFHYLTANPDNPNHLNNNDVRAIYQDQDNNLWIGTKGGGLNKFDAQTGRPTYYQNNPQRSNTLSSNDVYAITQDRAGRIWLGLSGGGLNQFDPLTDQVVARYRSSKDDPTSISSDDLDSIYEDRSGLLWIGTKGGGLNKFDPQTGQFTRYQYNPTDPTSLGNNDVYAIYEDHQGVLWVSTYGGGLNKLNRETGQFTRYQNVPDDPTSLSNNDVYSLWENSAGILWIGTANGGLNRFDRETGRFTRFGQAEGLASNVIYGVLADTDGNLWLNTSKGLSKFNPSTGNSVNYDATDGLGSIVFNEGAYYKSQSGELFFGGINGLLHFNPLEIVDNVQPPAVVLTSFKLPDREIPLTKPLNQTLEIQLSYQDNDFSFEYAALDFTNPAKNQYAYQLEGFDQDWNYVGTRRFGTYTNLDPGTYTLRIKAANNAKVWNESGASLKIVITPPFWETWWFRVAAVIAVLGLAFTGYSLRVAAIQAQQAKLQRLVTERTTELSSANQNLRTMTERLQQELTIAKEIQQNLLPQPRPNWPDLDVLCFMTPAHEVGGDFYSYHAFFSAAHGAKDSLSSTSDPLLSRYAVALGDVSGKGMPAALLMATSLASLQSVLGQALAPAKLLAYLDEAIMPYTHTRFRQNCALCYVEISASPESSRDRIMRVANAGCVTPVIRRVNGSVEWVDVSGLPLGLGLGSQDGYTEVELTLKSKDLVILTSDGVVEARNVSGEMLGFERLEQLVATGPQTCAEAMLNHLQTGVLAFVGEAELYDDLTIVVVQV
ncbi:MAG: two-component regulator propeller domain-containing protein [Anaerolineae bacterium]